MNPEFKKCKDCGLTKPIAEFAPRELNYYKAWCLACDSKRYKIWYRKKGIEFWRERDRLRRKNPRFNKLKAINTRKYLKAHPEIASAHRKVTYAKRLGILKRQPCSRCGFSAGRVDAHHPDYSKPLEVVWLCQQCHAYVHHHK